MSFGTACSNHQTLATTRVASFSCFSNGKNCFKERHVSCITCAKKMDKPASLASIWSRVDEPPAIDNRSAQVQIRMVHTQSLSTRGPAMMLQELSDRRDGKVTGKSLKTVVGSMVRSGMYIHHLLDSRPIKRRACRGKKKTLKIIQWHALDQLVCVTPPRNAECQSKQMHKLTYELTGSLV